MSKLLKMLTTWTQVKAGKKLNWSGSPPATGQQLKRKTRILGQRECSQYSQDCTEK